MIIAIVKFLMMGLLASSALCRRVPEHNTTSSNDGNNMEQLGKFVSFTFVEKDI